MLLALDVGNTQIYGGVFKDDKLLAKFRGTSGSATSDEFGTFFKAALRENGIDPKEITEVAICSVVPDLIYALHQASAKYFGIEPFLLQGGIKTGLNIKYKNPLEVGADRIANAIAAAGLFPDKDLIIVDLGTATTFCAVSKKKEYLGGVIMPGLRISMEALASRTAKLPRVEIARPSELVGKTTIDSIQSGLYYSNLLAIRGIAAKIKSDYFTEEALVIGTGGFSKLFEDAGLFDRVVPDLVLLGIAEAVRLNKNAERSKK
ncbi:MAG TPA: type III pantothenate kinase [Elusimicrobia bacterium]|nr:MAG: pantothenate kinase [Elusimicrobia bacterium GWF2_62_30]HBA59993.1 type III pantothenate kinase [Elusimicrobiota bacterium]